MPFRLSPIVKSRLLFAGAIALVVLPTALLGIFGFWALSDLEKEPTSFYDEAKVLARELRTEIRQKVLSSLPEAIPAGKLDEEAAFAGQRNYLEGHAPMAVACLTFVDSASLNIQSGPFAPDIIKEAHWQRGLARRYLELQKNGRISGFLMEMEHTDMNSEELIVYMLGSEASGDSVPAGYWVAWVLDTERIRLQLEQGVRELKTELPLLFDIVRQGDAEISREKIRFALPIDTQMLPLWTLVVSLDERKLPAGEEWRSRFYIWFTLLAIPLLLGVVWFVSVNVRKQLAAAKKQVDFVANVTHELKTPLTSIKMFIEMLISGRVRSKEEERESLDIILRESERLGRLIDRVLLFDKLDRNVKVFDFKFQKLPDIVRETVAIFRKQFEKESDVKVSLTIEPGLPYARVDHDAIRELLLNLLTNALKYGASDKVITVRLHRDAGWFLIDVIDRGQGIPVEEQGRIFEKFYRIDNALSRKVEGSGLGLTICKSIAEAHNGAIGVASEPGKGSRFTVYLPIVELPADIDLIDDLPEDVTS
ncbi:MAG: HAMP domain-containing histidine kinase [Planctomycetes bacterium]|nr:HAMP domain-containing histidine kinase [Planctomycetota bacterium]NUQ34940.1 hypothetical protein [Planctomycetaceae bacterium]